MFADKYIVWLIDENADQASDIEWYFTVIWGEMCEFIYIDPRWLTIEACIKQVYQNRIDFLLIDLKLMDGSDASLFNWDEFMRQINQVNPELPKAIVTNNPNDSFQECIESARIPKSDFSNLENTATFWAMTTSIFNYRSEIQKVIDRVDYLYEKTSKRNLSAVEESELYELEDRIYKVAWEDALSTSVISRTDIWRLWELLDATKKLLTKG